MAEMPRSMMGLSLGFICANLGILTAIMIDQFWMALFLDLGICSICFLLLKQQTQLNSKTKGALGLLSLLLPLFGPLFILIVINNLSRPRDGGFLQAYQDYIRYVLHKDSQEVLSREMEIRGQLRQLEPFAGIPLDEQSVEDKLRFIRSLERGELSKSAKFLKVMREDSNKDVAIAAASAFFILEASGLNLVQISREDVKKHPENKEFYNALARRILDYVESGFVDEDQGAELVMEALETLNQSLELDPLQLESLIERARIYMKAHQASMAMMDLEKALSIQAGHSRALSYLAEVHFQLGQHKLVRQTLRDIENAKGLPLLWQKYWLESSHEQ